MSKRKTTRIKRLTRNEVQLVAEMQANLSYLKQFVVNMTVMLMERGKVPAILITGQVSDDVSMLTEKCWKELEKFKDRYEAKIPYDKLPLELQKSYDDLVKEIDEFKKREGYI